MEHKSHLSQIRAGEALAVFDVGLGGGLGGVAACLAGGWKDVGGWGRWAAAQTDVRGSPFEVVMKRQALRGSQPHPAVGPGRSAWRQWAALHPGGLELTDLIFVIFVEGHVFLENALND